MFSIDQKVIATITAQGLIKGESCTVVDVVQTSNLTGLYFNYVVENKAGLQFFIRNGFLFLESATKVVI